MFEEMISLLKHGEIPPVDILRKRFDRALVKKLGVIKTPSSFWTSDKKINPDTKELLWAAILLEDRDSRILIEGIIATELSEKERASGKTHDPQSAKAVAEPFIKELLQLVPSKKLRLFLQQKINCTQP